MRYIESKVKYVLNVLMNQSVTYLSSSHYKSNVMSKSHSQNYHFLLITLQSKMVSNMPFDMKTMPYIYHKVILTADEEI